MSRLDYILIDIMTVILDIIVLIAIVYYATGIKSMLYFIFILIGLFIISLLVFFREVFIMKSRKIRG